MREKRLFDVGVKAQAGVLGGGRFYAVDTEQIAADAGEQANTLSTELAKQAARFDGLKLPPVMARKMLLLKLASGFPAPNNPEGTEGVGGNTGLVDGDYGRGKWCPGR